MAVVPRLCSNRLWVINPLATRNFLAQSGAKIRADCCGCLNEGLARAAGRAAKQIFGLECGTGGVLQRPGISSIFAA
jgi:hypothetical protein